MPTSSTAETMTVRGFMPRLTRSTKSPTRAVAMPETLALSKSATAITPMQIGAVPAPARARCRIETEAKVNPRA